MISRRHAIVASAVAGVIASVFFMIAQEKDHQNTHQNTHVSEAVFEKAVYGVLLGVYENAKKYEVKVHEKYIDTTFKEILPDVTFIAERRFVIDKK